MHISLTKKLLAGFLAMLLLAATLAVLPVGAAGGAVTQSAQTGSGSSGSTASGSDETEIPFYGDLAGGDAGNPYTEYLERHPAGPAKEDIVIDATQYDAENTTADVDVLTNFEGAGTALYMPNTGITSWKVTIPSTASYAFRITYFPIVEYEGEEVSDYTTVERTIYIDGRIPFSEARYLYFPRNWTYEAYEKDENGCCIFPTDASGNDIRPLRNESPVWQTYYFRDWLGYTMEPFQFTLTEGEHVISLEANREPIVITKIELYAYEAAPSFNDFLAQKEKEGYSIIDKLGDDIIKIQAEDPFMISNACLYPINDRTSALTQPQDPQKIRFNILNSTTVNQWMKYKVTVPESGLYTIAIRFRQNDLLGMFTSRRILINGDLQFEEASRIRFKYNSGWQSSIANNGEQNFVFFLEKGENEITFEVVLGDMAEYVYRVEHLIDELNAAYKTILQLTGPSPDAYRDYGFNRLVPEAVETIRNAATELYDIADGLEAVTGELGDQVATLNTIGILFETMGNDEYEIAPNFIAFKNYIVALSNWLYASLNQPLKMDYFTIQGQNDPLPRAQANFFEAIAFEAKAFVGSFFMDYTTVDFKSDIEYKEENIVESWITTALGRDDALVTRNLIDTYFTPFSAEKPEDRITVKMKVITTGLTEAILAGVGPDVAAMTSVDTITWGLRNAVEALDNFEGFEETVSQMDEAAIVPLQIVNAKGVLSTYGLPYNLDFYMMFYRSDVMNEVGVEIPKTWADLYDILPALQSADLEIGMFSNLKTTVTTATSTTIAVPGAANTNYEVNALEGLKVFVHQMGGKLYNDGGYSVALDENVGLDAFETFCDMFSKYKCPVEYDLTRFRTGEIPIYFGLAIQTYNTLMTYYDIRGLWKMAPLLGVEQADGTIDCTSHITVTSRVIPRGATNPEATWKYMSWSVSPDTQRRLARERLLVNANPTTKYNTPTIETQLGQAWTAEEKEAFATQAANLVGIREYPGNYILKTYINSAFLNVYNTSSDAAEQLQDRIVYINKELSRKRDDFKMDYYDVATGEYRPGRWISAPIFYE